MNSKPLVTVMSGVRVRVPSPSPWLGGRVGLMHFPAKEALGLIARVEGSNPSPTAI